MFSMLGKQRVQVTEFDLSAETPNLQLLFLAH
jgi:hypothetical protein